MPANRSKIDNGDENANKDVRLSKSGSNSTMPKPYGLKRHLKPSPIEYLLLVWILTLTFEEIRQVMYFL